MGRFDFRGVVLQNGAKGVSAPKAGGLKRPIGFLNRARYTISCRAIGLVEFCLRAAGQYGVDRRQFGTLLAGLEAF